MRINNVFSIDTFDYESILLGLLQLPNGDEMVRNNYQNIFNALQVLFSKNSLLRVENLITTFKKEGNLDMEAQVILTRLENLKNSIDSDPFTNLVTSGKYSITEGISRSWINEF